MKTFGDDPSVRKRFIENLLEELRERGYHRTPYLISLFTSSPRSSSIGTSRSDERSMPGAEKNRSNTHKQAAPKTPYPFKRPIRLKAGFTPKPLPAIDIVNTPPPVSHLAYELVLYLSQASDIDELLQRIQLLASSLYDYYPDEHAITFLSAIVNAAVRDVTGLRTRVVRKEQLLMAGQLTLSILFDLSHVHWAEAFRAQLAEAIRRRLLPHINQMLEFLKGDLTDPTQTITYAILEERLLNLVVSWRLQQTRVELINMLSQWLGGSQLWRVITRVLHLSLLLHAIVHDELISELYEHLSSSVAPGTNFFQQLFATAEPRQQALQASTNWHDTVSNILDALSLTEQQQLLQHLQASAGTVELEEQLIDSLINLVFHGGSDNTCYYLSELISALEARGLGQYCRYIGRYMLDVPREEERRKGPSELKALLTALGLKQQLSLNAARDGWRFILFVKKLPAAALQSLLTWANKKLRHARQRGQTRRNAQLALLRRQLSDGNTPHSLASSPDDESPHSSLDISEQNIAPPIDRDMTDEAERQRRLRHDPLLQHLPRSRPRRSYSNRRVNKAERAEKARSFQVPSHPGWLKAPPEPHERPLSLLNPLPEIEPPLTSAGNPQTPESNNGAPLSMAHRSGVVSPEALLDKAFNELMQVPEVNSEKIPSPEDGKRPQTASTLSEQEATRTSPSSSDPIRKTGKATGNKLSSKVVKVLITPFRSGSKRRRPRGKAYEITHLPTQENNLAAAQSDLVTTNVATAGAYESEGLDVPTPYLADTQEQNNGLSDEVIHAMPAILENTVFLSEIYLFMHPHLESLAATLGIDTPSFLQQLPNEPDQSHWLAMMFHSYIQNYGKDKESMLKLLMKLQRQLKDQNRFRQLKNIIRRYADQ